MGSFEFDFNISRAFFSKTHAIPFLLRPVPERVNYFNQLKSSLCATLMTKFLYPRNLFSLLGKFLSQSWGSHLGLFACLDIWGRALILCVLYPSLPFTRKTLLITLSFALAESNDLAGIRFKRVESIATLISEQC